MTNARPDWDFPTPFEHPVHVDAKAIDVMGHVNNVQYLRWLEDTAWQHSEALGMGWAVYQSLGCGVVATRHEIDYLRPSFAGDHLRIATWCTGSDGRLRLRRHYQVWNDTHGYTAVRGMTLWVSVDIKTGRPGRMPAEFVASYTPVAGSLAFP
ncbi:MAG: thioesterase family protein [Oceanococcaceae bacterium]